MNPTPRQVRALAFVTQALVQPYDITDVLSRMLHQTVDALSAQAAGLLVTNGRGDLELLASTSHATAELEVYQAQSSEGPCVDCVDLLAPVTACGERELVSRWPTVGPRILASGFGAVHAQPLRWHGRALGGLNVFFESRSPMPEDVTVLAQAFADVTTLALVQTQAPSDRELGMHIQEALDARTLIEHAKGVLVETQGLDPVTAYSTLLRLAEDQALTVTQLARTLVWQAHSG